jgi:hypothetical protein
MGVAAELDQFVEGIDALDLTTVSGNDVVALLHTLDRLQAKVAEAVERFDADGRWGLDGALSLTSWLRSHGGLSGAAAHRLARIARRLRDLPVVADAWHHGRLSTGQVDALCGHVTDANVALLADSQAEIVDLVAPLSVRDTAAVMSRWQVYVDALTDASAPADDMMGVSLVVNYDGTWHLDATLSPEGAGVVAAAMRRAAVDDVEGEPPRTFARRQGDALVDVCRWYLQATPEVPGARHRPHLNLVATIEQVAEHGCGQLVGELTAGAVVDPVTLSRLACDAVIHRVVTDGASTILDYGRASRVVPQALWNALVLRDRHCRFPGCDRPAHWAEAHHVRHWPDGGETRLENLVVFCSRHHHVCHLPGWQVKLLPDATVEVTTAAGKVLTSHPPPIGT